MATAKIKLADGGRIVIPVEFRKALGLKIGDELVAYVKDGEIHLLTREQAMKKVQDWFCSIVPRGLSLADELIQERREEAAREEREFYRK